MEQPANAWLGSGRRGSGGFDISQSFNDAFGDPRVGGGIKGVTSGATTACVPQGATRGPLLPEPGGVACVQPAGLPLKQAQDNRVGAGRGGQRMCLRASGNSHASGVQGREKSWNPLSKKIIAHFKHGKQIRPA